MFRARAGYPRRNVTHAATYLQDYLLPTRILVCLDLWNVHSIEGSRRKAGKVCIWTVLLYRVEIKVSPKEALRVRFTDDYWDIIEFEMRWRRPSTHVGFLCSLSDVVGDWIDRLPWAGSSPVPSHHVHLKPPTAPVPLQREHSVILLSSIR